MWFDFRATIKKILGVFLVEDKNIEKEFLGGQGAISTFEARIRACYYMGLIDDVEYKNLEIIRKVRNKFAHSFKPIDFNNQSIKDLCNNLKIPTEKYTPSMINFKENDILEINLEPFQECDSIRYRFIKTFDYLSMLFTIREFEILDKKIKKFEDKETIAYKQKKVCDMLEEALLKIIELSEKEIGLLEEKKELLEQIKRKKELLEPNKELLDFSDIEDIEKILGVKRKYYSNAIKNYETFKPIIYMGKVIYEEWNKSYEKVNKK